MKTRTYMQAVVGLAAGLLAGGAITIGAQAATQGDNPVQLTVGDATCDLEVNTYDALAALRYDAGLPPAGSECDDIVGHTYQLAPACQEDEVIIGTGDFKSTGYWDHYECFHPDNFEQIDGVTQPYR
jgi:hypothetical protein